MLVKVRFVRQVFEVPKEKSKTNVTNLDLGQKFEGYFFNKILSRAVRSNLFLGTTKRFPKERSLIWSESE